MSHMLLLQGGHVLDPECSTFLDDADTVCSDGRIHAIGHGLGAAEEFRGAQVVALDGRYVIPGLIDSHFHLISRSTLEIDDETIAAGAIEGVLNAARQIQAGVTTVRDAGCRHHGIHALKDAIAAGLVTGPRAFVAGLNPTGTGAPAGWRNLIVDGPEEMRKAVRREHAAGADWIKLVLAHADDPTDWASVVPYLAPAEITAAVDEAHWKGLKTGCHCEGWEVAKIAVECGIDTLDHAALINDSVAADMAERGVGYVPTVWAFTEDTGLPVHEMAPDELAAVQRWQEEHKRSIRRASEAGVTIAAGSDAMGAVPAADVLIRELRVLAGAGLTNRELVRAATINGAKVLGHDTDLGSIAKGKIADLVVLSADPLHQLDALEHPELVIKDGRIVFDSRQHERRSTHAEPQTSVVTSRWG